MRVVALLGVIVIVAIIALGIYALSLRRRLNGLDNPELWLPRKERRAYARELLARERNQYELQQQQDLIDVIRAEIRKDPACAIDLPLPIRVIYPEAGA